MLELPDGHPLLDDLYFHQALVAQHRNDKAGAYAALRTLQHRCPNTDLLANIRFLSDELAGRMEMGPFDD